MSALLVLVLLGLSCTAIIAQQIEGKSKDTKKNIELARTVENFGNNYITKQNLFERSPTDKATWPHTTVEAGRTKTGAQLIVIRAYHGGNLLPGKFDTGIRLAEISWGSRSYSKQNFQVARAEPGSVRWIPSSGGATVFRAIEGGYTRSGEILYVCRFRHGNETNFICGHLQPSYRLCYVPFEGGEAFSKDYEILVYTTSTSFPIWAH